MSSAAFGSPQEPTPLAKATSHAIVGGGVWLVVKTFASDTAAWLSAIIAVIAHALFDAPLAHWLGGLNFS